jgi:hypothetical protein
MKKGKRRQKESIQDNCSSTVNPYSAFGFPQPYFHAPYPTMGMFQDYGQFQSGPGPICVRILREEGNKGADAVIVKRMAILFQIVES